MAVAASYDKTGRYGAQTPFSDQLSAHWVGGLWQADVTHNSILAVTNGGTRETDALLTVFFNGGKDKYELQQTIAPGDQMWLNLGDIIKNRVPDRSGKILPLSLTSGTYELRDLKPGLGMGGNLFEGKVIVDKTWGHLAYGCMICCGFGNPYLDPDPLGLDVGSTFHPVPKARNNCSGYDEYVSFGSGWWTGNGSIATTQQGTVTGEGPGNTGNYASGWLGTGDGMTEIPAERGCPSEYQTAEDTAQVSDRVSLFNSACSSNPATGIANNLLGWWGRFGGCQLNDQRGIGDPDAVCTTNTGGTHCYRINDPSPPPGKSCTLTFCPGMFRRINGSCTGFVDTFPLESTQVCI